MVLNLLKEKRKEGLCISTPIPLNTCEPKLLPEEQALPPEQATPRISKL